MNTSPDPGSPAGKIWMWMPRIMTVVSAITVIWLVLLWFTGGLKPQTQIDVETLKTQVSAIQSDVAVLRSRFDALPRAADFAEMGAHFSRLDAVFEGLRDRLTKLEYDLKDLDRRVGGLVSVPSSQPSSRPRP